VFRRRRRSDADAGSAEAASPSRSAVSGPSSGNAAESGAVEDEADLLEDDPEYDDDLDDEDDLEDEDDLDDEDELEDEDDLGDEVVSEGPWDVEDSYPPNERIDLGSLRIPAAPGTEVQVNMADDHIVAATVVRGDSALQLHAFAAPKRSGLWDDVRQELIDELRGAGGTGEEADGPFGLEVLAQVPIGDQAPPGVAPGTTQPARFLGVDGPRWFLRGVISGPAAAQRELAHPLEDVFADIVVVRGDHPAPPRDLLELRLPAEAQQALEDQAAEGTEAASDRPPLELFQRGPEITEIR
jgi:hypothetical protein